MNRTISMMLGKGSVSHNSRKFNAKNTDPERSHYNRTYIDEPIKEVYHNLFDEATKRYNEKQTRGDRRIDNYYEKIRTGKQEKLFHEVIFQIGNKDDTGIGTHDIKAAVTVLDEYAKTFQDRNPNLYVFSAHLHLDEATPHLHIDFVPFTTGSNRGLDTRVSLKAALAAQGFFGTGRQETEWNKWVLAEKKELSQIMERHGIEWEKLGTTDEHLSVLNYKKEQRAKEVSALDKEINSKEAELSGLDKQNQNLQAEIKTAGEKHDEIAKRLDAIEKQEELIDLNIRRYDTDPEWQLSEPTVGMSAKSYKTKIVAPFVSRLKKVISSLVAQYLDLKSSVAKLRSSLFKAQDKVETLTDRLVDATNANKQLREAVSDFDHVKKAIGQEKIDQILKREDVPKIRSEWPDRIRDVRER